MYDSIRKLPMASNESLFRESPEKNAEVPFELPADISPAPDEMVLKEPYENAKCCIGIMRNFETNVARKAVHPLLHTTQVCGQKRTEESSLLGE